MIKHPGRNENPWKNLDWKTNDCFHLNGYTFELVSWGSPKKKSHENNFVLVKDQTFANSMGRILENSYPKTILEFGIYQGASLVLLDQLYKPDIIIGIDNRVGSDALLNYIQSRDGKTRFIAGYEMFQDDETAVARLLDEALAGSPLDLVIDDCSHLYLQSKRSFELTFPRLSEGGVYIIEDWGWAHWSGEFQERKFFEGTPLSQLIFELLMIQSSQPELIQRIEVDFHHVAVFRGTGAIDLASFSIDHLYRSNQTIRLEKR